MIKKFLLIALMLALLPIFVSASNDCYIASSCSAGDNPVFSVYQNENSHVKRATDLTLKVCCPGGPFAGSTSCNNANALFFTYQNENSHVSSSSGAGKTRFCFFNTVAENQNVNCNFRTNCLAGESCIVSVYSNDNSHVAACSVNTGTKVCCEDSGLFGLCGDLVIDDGEECDGHHQCISPGLLNECFCDSGDGKNRNLMADINSVENSPYYDDNDPLKRRQGCCVVDGDDVQEWVCELDAFNEFSCECVNTYDSYCGDGILDSPNSNGIFEQCEIVGASWSLGCTTDSSCLCDTSRNFQDVEGSIDCECMVGYTLVGDDCLPITNAVCGSAERAYAYDGSSYIINSNMCNPGTPSPTSRTLEADAGSTASWTCQGLNGGDDATCTATRSEPLNCPAANLVWSGGHCSAPVSLTSHGSTVTLNNTNPSSDAGEADFTCNNGVWSLPFNHWCWQTNWVVTDWVCDPENCSRSRTVTCVNQFDVDVGESFCPSGTRPATSENVPAGKICVLGNLENPNNENNCGERFSYLQGQCTYTEHYLGCGEEGSCSTLQANSVPNIVNVENGKIISNTATFSVNAPNEVSPNSALNRGIRYTNPTPNSCSYQTNYMGCHNGASSLNCEYSSSVPTNVAPGKIALTRTCNSDNPERDYNCELNRHCGIDASTPYCINQFAIQDFRYACSGDGLCNYEFACLYEDCGDEDLCDDGTCIDLTGCVGLNPEQCAFADNCDWVDKSWCEEPFQISYNNIPEEGQCRESGYTSDEITTICSTDCDAQCDDDTPSGTFTCINYPCDIGVTEFYQNNIVCLNYDHPENPCTISCDGCQGYCGDEEINGDEECDGSENCGADCLCNECYYPHPEENLCIPVPEATCGSSAGGHDYDGSSTLINSGMCSVGLPDESSVTLLAEEGSTVSWDCNVDTCSSVTCTAIRNNADGCGVENLNWGDGCYANTIPLNHNEQDTFNNADSYYDGSVTARCNHGNWDILSSSCTAKEYYWYEGPWDCVECSRSRDVFCRDPVNHENVADSFCPGDKPAISENAPAGEICVSGEFQLPNNVNNCGNRFTYSVGECSYTQFYLGCGEEGSCSQDHYESATVNVESGRIISNTATFSENAPNQDLPNSALNRGIRYTNPTPNSCSYQTNYMGCHDGASSLNCEYSSSVPTNVPAGKIAVERTCNNQTPVQNLTCPSGSDWNCGDNNSAFCSNELAIKSYVYGCDGSGSCSVGNINNGEICLDEDCVHEDLCEDGSCLDLAGCVGLTPHQCSLAPACEWVEKSWCEEPFEKSFDGIPEEGQCRVSGYTSTEITTICSTDCNADCDSVTPLGYTCVNYPCVVGVTEFYTNSLGCYDHTHSEPCTISCDGCQGYCGDGIFQSTEEECETLLDPNCLANFCECDDGYVPDNLGGCLTEEAFCATLDEGDCDAETLCNWWNQTQCDGNKLETFDGIAEGGECKITSFATTSTLGCVIGECEANCDGDQACPSFYGDKTASCDMDTCQLNIEECYCYGINENQCSVELNENNLLEFLESDYCRVDDMVCCSCSQTCGDFAYQYVPIRLVLDDYDSSEDGCNSVCTIVLNEDGSNILDFINTPGCIDFEQNRACCTNGDLCIFEGYYVPITAIIN